MRFIVGLAAVFAVAALAVVAFSVASGKDLGELAKDVRKDIDELDVSTIGKRVNESVATVEAALTERIDEIRGAAKDVETAASDQLEEAAPA
jgi:hypothetical protein